MKKGCFTDWRLFRIQQRENIFTWSKLCYELFEQTNHFLGKKSIHLVSERIIYVCDLFF